MTSRVEMEARVDLARACREAAIRAEDPKWTLAAIRDMLDLAGRLLTREEELDSLSK